MKKIYSIVLGVGVFFNASSQNSINLLSDVDGTINLHCQVSEWGQSTVQTELGDAWIINLSTGTPFLKATTPDLPKLTSALIVDNKMQMTVEIISSHFTEIENVLVAPSKGNLLRTTDPASLPFTFGDVYAADEFFPGKLADLGEAYIQGNVRGQAIHFYPFQYNPVTKVLRIYDNLEVSVVKTENMGQNALPENVSNKVNALYNDMYSKRFINYEANLERYEQVSEIGNLLVITAAEYLDELEPWIQWKREKGIPTEVVDIADIGNSTTAISNYVEDYYNDNGLTFLVLVGDEDQIISPLLNNSGGQGYCDPCYGYVNGNDSYAEVFVGRFLVHNDSELPSVIEKTLEYEKNPYMASDWYSIAMGIGSNEGDGFGDDGEADWEHQNDLKEDLMTFTYTEVWEKYDGSHSGASPTGGETADASGAPTSTSLTAVINDGCSLINYTGHGSHTSIVTGSYTNSQINALTNQHKYPYFIIVGCCVGDFDDDDASGDTFGEAWLKSMDGTEPAGGIGGAFSTVYQSWSPPMEGQDEMNNLIAEMGAYETRHTLGSIHTHGCASMNDEYGTGGDDMTDTWILMADPTVQLRTAYPTNLVVTYPAQTFLGANQVTVDCATEGAMVCISQGGEILGVGLIENGTINISVPTLDTPGFVLVTVSSFNTIPHQGQIEIVPLEGPYVIGDSEVLDDSLGNNNGQADYAESLMMDVTVENVGTEIATGVFATLTTSDPAVTITDNYHFYGDIAANELVFADGAFAFDVADGVTDQHIVAFIFTFEDANGNTWETDYNLVINAPNFMCSSGIAIDDTNGNNNGRIDAGETVTVLVPVFNDGHSTSANAVTSLNSSSAYITITNSTDDIGSLNANDIMQAEFEVVADDTIPIGEDIVIEHSTVAGMYQTGDCEFETTLNQIVEDWETGDMNTFDWQTSGESDWFTTTFQPWEGTYCLQSGNVNDDENSALTVTLNILESGQVTFAARTSSEGSWDYLNFYIDNVEKDEWSGEVAWAEYSYPVAAGVHTFKWDYIKDEIYSSGSDAGWVDNIVFPSFESAVNISESMASDFSLDVFPNPADQNCTLQFNLKQSENVWIELENALGQKVFSMEKGKMPSGNHNVNLNLESFEAGLYVATLRSSTETNTIRLVKK